MGSSLCKPRQPKKSRITTSSWISNENENPFENSFSKKERICLRETFQRLADPKEVVGLIFVDIVNEVCPEFKRIFGVDRAPKVTMLKMPKLGGHVSRMADFIEQMTLMIGFTENLAGAWQLSLMIYYKWRQRGLGAYSPLDWENSFQLPIGRLHAKVPFLEQNQNQLSKNYIAIVNEYFVEQFTPYMTGEKLEPGMDEKSEAERKKVRFQQNYSQQLITDVWKRFFSVCTAQMTEAFELERQKCLNADNQKTLAPHQHIEEAERRKRINAERANEMEANLPKLQNERKEELFEDPF